MFLKIAGGLCSLLIIFFIIYFIRSAPPAVLVLGNSRGELKKPHREFKINPEEAMELAKPYLDLSFRLRRKMRGEEGTDQIKETTVWVLFKGNYYYISKDDYPSYTPGYYSWHAVKVDCVTGEVIPPE
jgi:hypothetical protein